MTQDITSLIEKLEGAAKGSDYLSAHVVKTILAPEGAWVEQSKFNGAWCVYERREKPRLWGEANPLRQAPVTTSLDAALALAERVLGEESALSILQDTVDGWNAAAGLSIRTLPLLLCAALLRAQSEAR